ncbi:energy transducer TonB [Pedobacter sp. BMA]|uniref:energy transducer TonB n=1 Tax=Pedobacter sp. BMA TaxID=1663685 RepID=UPI00069FD084|nr:energy transducer TonB [Pedobacter sp. BMA]
MKLRFTLLFFIAVIASTYAQKAQNVYLFKDNGKQVADKADADYIRIIQEPDSGNTNFKLLEYYRNGKRKTIGEVKSFEPTLIFDGIIMSYDSLGRRTEMITYKDGRPAGSSIAFHPNGKVRRELEYLTVSPSMNQMIGKSSSVNDFIFNTSSKIMFDADSSGKVNIENGKGHLKVVNKFDDFESVEEGNYLDGLKTGEWTGYDTKSQTSFKENYEANKLIAGESLKDGITYKYTVSMQAPEFDGGQAAWNRFIASTTKYPSDAQRSGVRGTVYTSFVVDGKGRIVDIKIEKSVFPSLDEEARRVLQYSPKWEPGRQRGIPVRVKYNQSFHFNLR